MQPVKAAMGRMFQAEVQCRTALTQSWQPVRCDKDNCPLTLKLQLVSFVNGLTVEARFPQGLIPVCIYRPALGLHYWILAGVPGCLGSTKHYGPNPFYHDWCCTNRRNPVVAWPSSVLCWPALGLA